MTGWRKWSDPPPERHLRPLTEDEAFDRFVDRYGIPAGLRPPPGNEEGPLLPAPPLVAPHIESFQGGRMLQITTNDGTLHQVEFDRSCVISVKRRIEVGPGAWDWQDFVLTDVVSIETVDTPDDEPAGEAGLTAEELHAHLEGLERDALVAEAHVRGIENPHQTKSVVLVEEIYNRITEAA